MPESPSCLFEKERPSRFARNSDLLMGRYNMYAAGVLGIPTIDSFTTAVKL